MRINKIKSSRESEIPLVKEILDFLSAQPKCMVWRNTNHTRATHRSAYYRKGVPDILGIWRGRPLAVEVKKSDGVVSKEQIEFIEEFKSQGGIAFVARGVEDVLKALIREPEQAPPDLEHFKDA